MKSLIFLTILAVFFISACACKAANSETIAGKSYVFSNFNGQPVSQKTSVPSLAIAENMQVNGKLCNTFGGSATIDNGTIRAEMISTRMFCLDGDINKLESAFFSAMAKGAEFKLNGKTLTIESEENIFILEEQ